MKVFNFAIKGCRMNVKTDGNCTTGIPLEAEHKYVVDFFLSEVAKHLKI